MKTDALLISSVHNVIYHTNFSGFSTEERDGFLLIAGKSKYLITNALYAEEARDKAKNCTVLEWSATNPLSAIFKKLVTKHKIRTVGFEAENLSVQEYMGIKKYFGKLQAVDLSENRIIKTKQEIDQIEKACDLGDQAFAYILTKLKLGITEKELAYELEFFIKQQGHDISFRPIVAFGPNSAVPHHKSDDTKLTKNSIVLFDFGAKVDNYCSDMSRTVFFGKASAEFKKLYQTVLEAQTRALKEILKQVQDDTTITARNVDKIARDYIVSQGYSSIPHSLGHGIGLEVHEAPSLSPYSKDVLEDGMVFSIEPGIYLPKIGGMRIEDLVVIENKKVKLLTRAPRELIEA